MPELELEGERELLGEAEKEGEGVEDGEERGEAEVSEDADPLAVPLDAPEREAQPVAAGEGEEEGEPEYVKRAEGDTAPVGELPELSVPEELPLPVATAALVNLPLPELRGEAEAAPVSLTMRPPRRELLCVPLLLLLPLKLADTAALALKRAERLGERLAEGDGEKVCKPLALIAADAEALRLVVASGERLAEGDRVKV